MSSEPPLVAADKVWFSRHGTDILIDVSLEVFATDFLAVIGPNGSGKSTLIKIILGLLKPSRGEVRLFGQTPARFRQWHRIGYVAQKATHIDPYFPVSVREVVAMGLLAGRMTPILPTRKDEEAIAAALGRVGISHLGKRMIGELSGGEQQRVFIARAIAHNPSVLFLDEPTTGIDSEARDQFYAMLDDLTQRAGMAVVLVTHDIGVVTRHVRKLACLNHRLYFHGTHDEFCQCSTAQSALLGEDHIIDHVH